MKKSMANNAIFNIAYNLLNVVFPLISSIYVSRILGAEGVGVVAYARNIASYFLMFAMLGIPSYGTRLIAQRKDDLALTQQAYSELLSISFVSTVISALAYFLMVWFVFPQERLLYFVFGFEILFNILNIDWFYRGREEYAYIAVRSTVIKILSLAALFLFVRDRQDYIIYAIILCFGVGANYIFNVIHASKTVKLRLRKLQIRQHIKPIVTLMLSSATATLYSKVDITMLGSIAGQAQVGYYNNANKITHIILTLSTAISAVFLPRLSYVYQTDKKKFDYYVSNGLKVVLATVLPCCAGLVIVAKNLIDVFYGPMFAAAVPVMRILSVLTIIKGVGDILCYQVLLSTGNEKKFIWSHLVAGIANIVLNSFMIPVWGAVGAGIASVVSELIVNGILLVDSLKIVKPKMSYKFLLSCIASTVIMGIVAGFVQSLFNQAFLGLAFGVMAGVVTYIAGLIFTKNEIWIYAIEGIKKKAKKE